GALGATTAVAQVNAPSPVVDPAAAISTSEPETTTEVGAGASLPVVDEVPSATDDEPPSDDPVVDAPERPDPGPAVPPALPPPPPQQPPPPPAPCPPTDQPRPP